MFLLLRSLTYIGWAAQRPEGTDKVGQYAEEALQLAAAQKTFTASANESASFMVIAGS